MKQNWGRRSTMVFVLVLAGGCASSDGSTVPGATNRTETSATTGVETASTFAPSAPVTADAVTTAPSSAGPANGNGPGTYAFTLAPDTAEFFVNLDIAANQEYVSWRLDRTEDVDYSDVPSDILDAAILGVRIAYDEASLVKYLVDNGQVANESVGQQWLVDNCAVPTIAGAGRRDLGWLCNVPDGSQKSHDSLQLPAGVFAKVTVIVSETTVDGAWPGNLHPQPFTIELGSDNVDSSESNESSRSVNCAENGDCFEFV